MRRILSILLLILSIAVNAQMAVGIGVGIQFSNVQKETFDKDAISYFQRMTTPPSDSFKLRVNTFIKEQKASGLWDKKAVIVLLQAESAQAATLNMKGDYNNATFVNSPTWAAGDGLTADVGYINTNFNPTTHGGTIFTLDNCGMTLYYKNDLVVVSSSSGHFVSTPGSVFVHWNRRSSVSLSWVAPYSQYVGVSSIINIADTNGIGVFQTHRTASNASAFYRNELQLSTSSSSSVSLINSEIYVGKGNHTGATPAGYKYGLYEITSGLTDEEALINYNQLKTLLNYTP